MLVKKPKPRFSWQKINPAASFLTHGAKCAYALNYGEETPGIVFSWDDRLWWFRSVDGRDSKLSGESGLTFTEARKALKAHVRYVLGLK